MKIIIEKNIPFIKGYLDKIADVHYLAADEITAAEMKDTDVLITRTRTKCDASLLEGSRCRLIATATIGTDHIDLDYCRDHNITVVNAPGCNAPAVAQYVFASIALLMDARKAEDLTIGIVGVGNVGTIIENWARKLGFNVLLCDPPRKEKEGNKDFVDFSLILEKCDIITFHTPLTRGGKHSTFHLFDNNAIGRLGRKPVIINAARGPVVDNSALLQAIEDRKIDAAIIDCWENEPSISLPLLEKAAIATPHIAGYSLEGKIRATQMVLNAFTRHFKMEPISFNDIVPSGPAGTVTMKAIIDSYNPLDDTAMLKGNPQAFEALRNNYNYRHEVR